MTYTDCVYLCACVHECARAGDGDASVLSVGRSLHPTPTPRGKGGDNITAMCFKGMCGRTKSSVHSHIYSEHKQSRFHIVFIL